MKSCVERRHASNMATPPKTNNYAYLWILCAVLLSRRRVDGFSHHAFQRSMARHLHPDTRSYHRSYARISSTMPAKTGEGKAATARRGNASSDKERRKPENPTSSMQSLLSTSEMLSHKNLSADEEKVLGKKIREAMLLKEEIRSIIEDKDAINFERFIKQQEYTRLLKDVDCSNDLASEEQEDFNYSTIHGLDGSFFEESLRRKKQLSSTIKIQYVDEDLDDLWATKASIEYHENERQDFLSDEDLERLGGRKKVKQVLIEGAIAREKIISSNIRLVLSVAKKWSKNAASKTGSFNIYGGDWTRPSLDEAVQEGIVGLATAADRFDYQRNLRFSTYATYWITNYIRRCFQDALTGSLRVPSNIHLIRQKYEKLVMAHHTESDGSGLPLSEAAKTLDITMEKLDFVLRSTDPLVPLDAPIEIGMSNPSRFGKTGGDDSAGSVTRGELTPCTEPKPEEMVEVSFLRQCLENAMSSELTPHERDVVRLRYGLDDGETKTVKETGQIMMLKASQVRRAEYKAFRKLRSPHSVHTYNLLGFLDYIGADARLL